ncbi:junctional adhesion molecule 2A-like [Arctopsyche grandis]|uniref:junctional adhesion molecule 2A-like n=1 Tax=Arctopsyche grandis TaxID=121162 RepID=UPI00406D8B66
MENVIVPPYVMQGDMAELICQFQLEQDNLYSVIWYKDHEEFYRYIPKSIPRQQSFKLDGAKIDHQRSGVHLVRMRVNSPAASGVYRCEVSAEAPSFTSAQGESRMEVVSLPIDDPIITGDIRLRRYQNGDTLALNCTAGKSYPPAQIVWFVNDKQVHTWFDYQGNLDKGSISELRLKLSKSHLSKESLLVRCVTIVGSQQYPIDTKETILLIIAKCL